MYKKLLLDYMKNTLWVKTSKIPHKLCPNETYAYIHINGRHGIYECSHSSHPNVCESEFNSMKIMYNLLSPMN